MRINQNLTRAAGRMLMLGAFALLAAGCGPEYVYFRPAENPQGASPGWVAQGRYLLPPDTQAVSVDLSVRGVIEKKKKAEETRSLEVRFAVRNRGPQPWTLDPATAKIIDDEGRVTAGARAYQDKSLIGVIAVPGAAQTTFLLVFTLPANIRFEELGSLRVVWPSRYGDKAIEGNTKFIRIEEVTYYSPDYYYPYYYGPYPYPYGPYPYPYPYGPWYDPWYGPYGYGGYYHRHRH
jgi:hypothetical protein